MSSFCDPIQRLVDHVDTVGATREGRRRTARWVGVEPYLAQWTTAGHIAAGCRAGTGPEQDRIIRALLSVAVGDELAELTAVAGLAGRLRTVLAGWERGGAARWELPGLASDLVSGCWVAVIAATGPTGDLPDRLAWHLVDEAREELRVGRRRQRRQAARQVPVDGELGLIDTGRPPVEDRLALAITDAVRARRITPAAAAPVFLTRVVGFPVAEAAVRLGCTPAAIRSIRSRAERRLAAA